MNFGFIGWKRAVRGAREGDQTLLLTGIGLILFQYVRSTRPKKQLLYRKAVPVGSTVVVRHGRRGEPRLEIQKPRRGRSEP